MSTSITEEFIITSNGSKIAIGYYNNDKKETLLFIAGIGAWRKYWYPLFREANLSDYNLLALDLPGQGDTTVPSTFSYTMEDQAILLAEALEKKDLDITAGVFHSMAGVVGAILCNRMPNLMSNFIGIESLYKFDPQSWTHMASKMPENDYSKFWKMLQNNPRNMYASSLNLTDEGRVNEAIDIMIEGTKKSTLEASFNTARSLGEVCENSLDGTIRNINLKKSYLIGERNLSSFEKDMDLLSEMGFDTKIVGQSGHMMMLEQPSLVAEIIKGVL